MEPEVCNPWKRLEFRRFRTFETIIFRFHGKLWGGILKSLIPVVSLVFRTVFRGGGGRARYFFRFVMIRILGNLQGGTVVLSRCCVINLGSPNLHFATTIASWEVGQANKYPKKTLTLNVWYIYLHLLTMQLNQLYCR